MQAIGLGKADDGRPLWVRWSEFGGWTTWRKADRVSASDSWLIVEVDDENTVMVPDHIVRGLVEVRTSAEQPAASG